MDINILFNPWVILAVLVELILKGIALWRCGRNNQSGWFIAIFILNTVGILPMIYLFAFQKKKPKTTYY